MKFTLEERLLEESKLLGDSETARLLEEASEKLVEIRETISSYAEARSTIRKAEEGSEEERVAINYAAFIYSKLFDVLGLDIPRR